MNFSNYKMPFQPDAVMQSNGALETCDTPESIAQNIMLLIITRKGENRFEKDYGNAVWDLEFDNGIPESKWERVFSKSLKQQIADYEPRLVNATVSSKISYVEHTYELRKFTEIKRKVNVKVHATISESGERFNFETQLFLSPMSVG